MKYYIHKKTGEPLATIDNTMCDVYTSEVSEEYPYLGVRDSCITLCVFPNRWCANGVPFQAISYNELRNFKRIAKNKFFELCPDFGQLRHKNDMTLERINKYHELLTVPKRKETFGNE